MKKEILFLLLLPLMWAATHKFYVSNTIVEWNTRTNNVEITCKMFTDDFERALMKNTNTPLKLGDEAELPGTNEKVVEYITEHFKLQMDDRPVMLSYIGKETEADLTYIYFEFTPPPSWNVISIENTLLFDLFPEQKNIVDLRTPTWSKSLFLTKEKSKEILSR
ncbi:MAG: hypothetical protein IT223_06120 [Crocinitomicaceae bacterium]|nr:hypothetical protein [Crocinitomicaceae bacterium]